MDGRKPVGRAPRANASVPGGPHGLDFAESGMAADTAGPGIGVHVGRQKTERVSDRDLNPDPDPDQVQVYSLGLLCVPGSGLD